MSTPSAVQPAAPSPTSSTAAQPQQALEAQQTEQAQDLEVDLADESEESLEASESEQTEAKPLSKEAKKELKKKLKLKVDGEEFEEEVDLEDEDYLKRQLQLAKVSQKRMKEYAQLQKEVKEAFDLLKKNPRKFLSNPDIGIDIKELARQVIEEEVENARKSPEQLEKERLMAELQELKEQREREQKALKDKELKLLQDKYYQEYENKIDSALTKAHLPRSPYIVERIGSYLYDAAKLGYKVEVEDVVSVIQEEMKDDLKQMFGVMPDEVLESIIDNNVYNRMRKRRVSNKKPPAPVKTAIKDVGQQAPKKEEKPAQKMTIKEMFKI